MNVRTLALAAALALVPGAALAAPASVEVKYRDLDLSTPEGTAKLNKRIEAAAREVCTTRIDTGSIKNRSLDSHCYTETLQKLQQQIALVTQHHQQG